MTNSFHDLISKLEARSPIPFPHPHFMSFAPLDVWLRLLARHAPGIPPRYYLRLFTSMWPSLIGTALTAPERLAYHHVLKDQYHASQQKLLHPPGSVFVLGYFRSGTTHLQYLLNCDPQLHTPKWYHVSAPHGFVFAWSFLRLFMIPFLSETRPMDDVSFGPEFPAEDDFALNNLALASATTGRLLLPHQWDDYRHFHDLQSLNPGQFERWQFNQWAFLYKISRLAKHRRLLLKSPSHTARIPELLQMLNPAQTRLVHLTRNPDDIIRSNVKMIKRLAIYHFQDLPSDSEIERRVIEEYVATEERYLATRHLIPEGNLVEIHYDDLVAEPVATLRLVYQQLNLEWSEAFDKNLAAYLASIRSYQPNRHAIAPTSSAARLKYDSRLHQITTELQDSRTQIPAPSIGDHSAVTLQPTLQPRNTFKHLLPPVIASVICVLLWILVADLAHNRYDWLVWPSGIAIGYVALRTRGIGSPRLGFAAAALTLLVLLAVAIPNTRNIYYQNLPNVPFDDVWGKVRIELTAGATIFWAIMGSVTAYRFASRTRIAPGGQ